MAHKNRSDDSIREPTKKKTGQGQGKHSKHGNPGPFGGNKGYRKKYRGQGK